MNDDRTRAADDGPDEGWEDKFDEGIIAADDTGMLSGERIITTAVIGEGDSDNAGGV